MVVSISISIHHVKPTGQVQQFKTTTKLGTDTNDLEKVMLFGKDVIMRCSVMVRLADHSAGANGTVGPVLTGPLLRSSPTHRFRLN